MSDLPPELAPAPARDVPNVVEVKLIVATVITFLGGLAYAVLDAVSDDASVLDGLPPWLRFVVLAALPAALAGLAGYRTPSNRV